MIKPVSAQCNLECSYCFYKDEASKRENCLLGVMSKDTLRAIVTRVFEYAQGLAVFVFQGGEPTLAGRAFFEDVIALEKELNVKNVRIINTLQTNGVEIDEDWARFFSENGFLVGVSLDGIASAHDAFRARSDGAGSFESTERAIDVLLCHGNDVNVLCVVNSETVKQPKQVYASLKKYKYIQFIPCIDPLEGEGKGFSLDAAEYGVFLSEVFREYYMDALRGEGVSIRNFDDILTLASGGIAESCAARGACTCSFVCESDGSVYPCDFYALDEWCLGNVREEGFKEMLGSEKAKEFVLRSLEKSQECRECPYYALCRGGCYRQRTAAHEKNGKDRFCEAYRYFYSKELSKIVDLAKRRSRGHII